MSDFDKYEIVGERWSPNPRERRLRVVAQLMDKPLFVILAFAAAAAVAKIGKLIPGYEPSAWFSVGLWLLAVIALRIVIVAGVTGFRAAFAIPAPRREGAGRARD